MGRPKYILLVRHGESAANTDKSVNRFVANHNVKLTDRGHDQAREAGLVLRQFLQHESFDEEGQRSISFYTSPYCRARQTCNEIIKGIKDLPGVKYDINEEPRMREQDFGNFQSTADEMKKIWEERAHYGHFFYRIPHGESAADVYDRISSFNESLFRRFQQDDFPNILVLVTHGIWARVFLMRWFRWSYEQFESLKNIPHCQYLIMKKNDKHRYKLKSHLETWVEVPDDELQQQIESEVTQEVCFNSQHKITNPEDFDIKVIIEAQQHTIQQMREKNKLIADAYNKAKANVSSNDVEQDENCRSSSEYGPNSGEPSSD